MQGVAAQLCCLAVLLLEQQGSGQLLLESGARVNTCFQVEFDVLTKEVNSGFESVT